MERCAAIVGLVLIAAPAAAAQPELVCDFQPILAGEMEGSTLRSRALEREHAAPLRLTFRDIDPRAGTAMMSTAPSPAAVPVAVTVEAGAITYLHEQPGAGKTLVSTQSKATPEGWPAVLSQHGWNEARDLNVTVMKGVCRMRAR